MQDIVCQMGSPLTFFLSPSSRDLHFSTSKDPPPVLVPLSLLLLFVLFDLEEDRIRLGVVEPSLIKYVCTLPVVRSGVLL